MKYIIHLTFNDLLDRSVQRLGFGQAQLLIVQSLVGLVIEAVLAAEDGRLQQSDDAAKIALGNFADAFLVQLFAARLGDFPFLARRFLGGGEHLVLRGDVVGDVEELVGGFGGFF